MTNAIREIEVLDALRGLGDNQKRLLHEVDTKGPVVPQTKLWVGVADSLTHRGILWHDCSSVPWSYKLTVLGQIAVNERNCIHSCMACGRAEDACSADPCDAVLADRGEEVGSNPLCPTCGTDHSDSRDRAACEKRWREIHGQGADHSLDKEDARNTDQYGHGPDSEFYLFPGEFYQHPYPTQADTNMDPGSIRGYDIVACDGMDHPAWELQRVDDIDRFKSDSDAQWQAIQDAVNGDQYAQRLVWMVMLQVSPETNMGSPSWLRSAWESQAWVTAQVADMPPQGSPRETNPPREMQPMDIYPMVSCIKCGSPNVQISYPAWHNPNADLTVVESDLEADPLSCHCLNCEDSGDATLLTWEFGEPQTICGRW